jgi:crotonobetainyl-CoA hydratase
MSQGEHSASEAAVVLTERRGSVLVITINRPATRNAVNMQVHLGIGHALEMVETDATLRACILTGAGDKSFCAGADLVAFSRGEKILPDDPVQKGWGFAGFVSHPISKPVIAAVNGFALGGGTEIALAADLVVASETASFGLPEVKRGLYPGAGGAFRLVDQLPRKVAMELLLTGDPISAARALELGLINAVVSPADVLPAALQLADRIVGNAPLSVRAVKCIALGIEDGRVIGDDERWARSRALGAKVVASEDAREGARAFAERRPPVWKGI